MKVNIGYISLVFILTFPYVPRCTRAEPVYSAHAMLYKRYMPKGVSLEYLETNRALDEDILEGKDTKVTIHGYDTSRYSMFSIDIREAFLNAMDVNIIEIDWSELATRNRRFSFKNLPQPAKRIAYLLSYMSKHFKLNISTTQFIGYGIGSHLAGLAARHFRNPKIAGIVALDPATDVGEDEPNLHLHYSNAQYVESIQTGISSQKLSSGYEVRKAYGTVDFFVNGGKHQPGCSGDEGCSERRSILLFIESLKAGRDVFIGIKCQTIEDAILQPGKCSTRDKAVMGGRNITKNQKGIYAIGTKGSPPYYYS